MELQLLKGMQYITCSHELVVSSVFKVLIEVNIVQILMTIIVSMKMNFNQCLEIEFDAYLVLLSISSDGLLLLPWEQVGVPLLVNFFFFVCLRIYRFLL